ncbi:DUF3570 domain-containing protein [Undibacterium flavidum]|uniref:DUF3570 domain-containing protein n=1 Tax=Undibacterium flavidum TaxID=2762297 RepID=A0ABR6Y945_9BURK|nr:DUF3570 domain-containing protein [Undibacterium flavidum]MBC3873147.1 DUF3570 domain-containing protein [Undibacterium flavidum]
MSDNIKASPSILLAALSLSGVLPAVTSTAHAEDAPDKAEVSVKYLRYRDQQPGLDRLTVNSPSLSLSVPLAGLWSLDAGLIADQVSGASPRYHTAVSSASKMSDSRRAADLKLHRYFERVKLSAGIAYSTEHDYDSTALSLNASIASEDNNTTWNLGVGNASDKITATGRVLKEEKNGHDFLIGVSQVLSPVDIAQLTFTHTNAHGYFSDAYKSLDIRPRERQQSAMLLKYHHYFTQVDGTLRLNYRHYHDSFGIRSHTINLEYAQSLGDEWTITPMLRLYSQSAADFYFDPVYTFLFIPVGYKIGGTQFVSEDQRMSAFGGRSFGLKLSKQVDQHWQVDASLERYRQRSDWTFFENHRPALASLNASMLQIGLRYRY